jgi:hypothetical protein
MQADIMIGNTAKVRGVCHPFHRGGVYAVLHHGLEE